MCCLLRIRRTLSNSAASGERSEVLFFGRSCRMVFLWPLKITASDSDIGTNYSSLAFDSRLSSHVVKPVLRS